MRAAQAVIARRAAVAQQAEKKLANVEGWRIRKETEKNGREEGEFLVKKGCKEGGVSL